VQVVRLLFLSGVLGFCWLGRSPGGVALGNAMSPAALFCRHECSLECYLPVIFCDGGDSEGLR
jgi:hypothetical protein